MNGLPLQINITGNLEKDQELLLLGMVSLVSLITLAMIIILIIVIVRRIRRNKEAKKESTLQASTAPPQVIEQKPVVVEKTVSKPVEEKKPTPIVAEKKPIEEKPAEVKKQEPVIVPEIPKEEKPIVETKQEPIVKKEEPAPIVKEEPKKEEPKKEEPQQTYSSSKPVDKMEEIRRRLEEIKGQKKDGPALVLPKIEAAPSKPPVIEEKKEEPTPTIAEETFAEEADETMLVENIETSTVPPIDIPEEKEIAEEEPTIAPTISEPIVAEEQPRMVEDEGIMKPASEVIVDEPEEPIAVIVEQANIKSEEITTHLPNGKFLPMKKLTFAEWVELFK